MWAASSGADLARMVHDSRLRSTRQVSCTLIGHLLHPYTGRGGVSRIAVRVVRCEVESRKRLGRRRWVDEQCPRCGHRFQRMRTRDGRLGDINQAFVSPDCSLICWKYFQELCWRSLAANETGSAEVYKQLINAGTGAFPSTESHPYIYKLLMTGLDDSEIRYEASAGSANQSLTNTAGFPPRPGHVPRIHGGVPVQ